MTNETYTSSLTVHDCFAMNYELRTNCQKYFPDSLNICQIILALRLETKHTFYSIFLSYKFF